MLQRHSNPAKTLDNGTILVSWEDDIVRHCAFLNPTSTYVTAKHTNILNCKLLLGQNSINTLMASAFCSWLLAYACAYSLAATSM